jgi:hypothetical protein
LAASELRAHDADFRALLALPMVNLDALCHGIARLSALTSPVAVSVVHAAGSGSSGSDPSRACRCTRTMLCIARGRRWMQ